MNKVQRTISGNSIQQVGMDIVLKFHRFREPDVKKNSW